jgi:CDP-paratose 2-epimerase
MPIEAESRTSTVDIPLYISDYRKAAQRFSWQPEYSVEMIVEDIFRWLKENEVQLKPFFV